MDKSIPTSSPTFYQRLTSFIDSPCTGTDVPLSPVRSNPSTPRLSNRCGAPSQTRRQRLRALQHEAEFSSRGPRATVPPPGLRRVKSNPGSPASVASSSFWNEETSKEDVCCAPEETGDSSLLSMLNCCVDTTTPSSVAVDPTLMDCGGYIDYSGKHHPHSPVNCQGCIFRRSLYDGRELQEEDLYYDSDCGELFGKEDGGGERKRRKSHVAGDDRLAHLYDYFVRDSTGATLRTGRFATTDEDVEHSVQEALNFTWRLQYHPPPNLRTPQLPPKLCNVWIERGYRRNRNEVVEPRLMWREMTQASPSYGHYPPVEVVRPCFVSLMAIRRIFPGASRVVVPGMAKPECLLIVRTSLGVDYRFEASSEEERDRIVHLWKITTARLVSHAVLGDGERMVQEFFNEYTV